MTGDKSSLKLEDVTKCPFCGSELEKGYVYSGNQIQWDIKRHRLLPDYSSHLPVTPAYSYPASRCPGCLAIIFIIPPPGQHKILTFLNTPDYLKVCPECKCEIPKDDEVCEFCGAHQPERK
jgi:hypothetical protein